jgi:ankyrin repeat protein
LHAAVNNNSNFELFDFLLESGVPIDARNNDELTALLDAARSNSNVEVLKYLISKGASINATTGENGCYILQYAIFGGNFDVAKYIVETIGMNVSIRNNQGPSPMDAAAYKNNVEIGKYLLDKGADISHVSSFMVALELKSFDFIKFLLEIDATTPFDNCLQLCEKQLFEDNILGKDYIYDTIESEIRINEDKSIVDIKNGLYEQLNPIIDMLKLMHNQFELLDKNIPNNPKLSSYYNRIMNCLIEIPEINDIIENYE